MRLYVVLPIDVECVTCGWADECWIANSDHKNHRDAIIMVRRWVEGEEVFEKTKMIGGDGHCNFSWQLISPEVLCRYTVREYVKNSDSAQMFVCWDVLPVGWQKWKLPYRGRTSQRTNIWAESEFFTIRASVSTSLHLYFFPVSITYDARLDALNSKYEKHEIRLASLDSRIDQMTKCISTFISHYRWCWILKFK